MSTIGPSQQLPSLLRLIEKAQKAVPAVKYAVGLIGVAAAAGVVNIILGHTRASVILLILVFFGMVVLFLFATLVSTKSSSSIQAAANVVLWTVVLIFSGTLMLGFSALAARWPPGVADLPFPTADSGQIDT
jgi:hypothetical protein